jgi:uncharacterized phage protein (TIGR02220 family)
MENNGWIKLHRTIMETPDWLSEPFTKAQAWIDLLLLANYKTGYIRKRGILITVDRGQVGYAEESLAERWQWSRGKVRRFLVELARLSRISRKISEKTIQKKTSVSNLISIINYDAYQAISTEDGTENGRKTVQEQEEQEEKENIYRKNALEVLSYLNKKTGRHYRDASSIESRLKAGGKIQECITIIDNKLRDPFFIKNPKFYHPTTLFRKSHWDQYLNEIPETSSNPKNTPQQENLTCPCCGRRIIVKSDLTESGCVYCQTGICEVRT